MNRPVSQAILLSVLIAIGTSLAACSAHCPTVASEYQRSVAAEARLTAGPVDQEMEALDFGATVRFSLVNRVLEHALSALLSRSVDVAEQISVASGQSFSVRTTGDVAKISLGAHDACDTCLSVQGKLSGTIAVKLPVIGIQNVPLAGSLRVVAPVTLATGKDGQVLVQLDLPKAASLGASALQTQMTQLPPMWRQALERSVSQAIEAKVLSSLRPVTLFSFSVPDLGVSDLKVWPEVLRMDKKQDALFVGLASNLPRPSGGRGLPAEAFLGKGEGVRVDFDAGLLVSVVSALIRDEVVSRTYDSEGRAAADGAYHVVLSRLGFVDGGPDRNMEIGFRAWKLKGGGPCFWVDARAVGFVGVKDDVLQVTLDEVKVVDSSLPGLAVNFANWLAADFLQSGAEVLKKSLSQESISLPSAKLAFSGLSFDVKEPNTLSLGARVEVDSPKP
jgi:hypothetical protein